MTWNHDITAAPRGEERTKCEYHVAPVWLAFADGKVKRSYWLPGGGLVPARWSGCTAAETPIAWQHFVVPEHPFANTPQQQGTDGGEISAVKGKARLENATGVEPSPSIHFLEDCGSGT